MSYQSVSVKPYLFLLAILFSLNFLASGQTVSELKENLKTASETEKIDIYVRLAEMHLPDNGHSALAYSKEALKTAQKLNSGSSVMARIYNVLGASYFHSGDNFHAVEAYENELKMQQTLGKGKEQMNTMFNIASAYRRMKNNGKAAEYYLKALHLAETQKAQSIQIEACRNLYEVYESMSRYKDALDYHKQMVKLRDVGGDQKVNQELFVLRNQYQSILAEKEEKEKELQNTDTELQRAKQKEQSLLKGQEEHVKEIENLHTLQNLTEKELQEKDLEAQREKELRKAKEKELRAKQRTLLLFIGIVSLSVFFTIVSLRLFYQKKKANDRLEAQNQKILEQNEEITAQRDKIEGQNRDITASIRYAQRIQAALLPQEEFSRDLLKEYFIIYIPRDIVSGDFYWFTKKGNRIIIAIADCTGHGVPGAFMSLLGISFLNDIVNNKGVQQPAQILNRLRTEVITSLKQTKEAWESREGMDIVVLNLDTESHELQFAGAYNPLIVMRNGKTTVYSGDKMPIGMHHQMPAFTNQLIQVQRGDVIYAFSDGFSDQFGGPEGRRFGVKNLQVLLEKMAIKNLQAQKNALEQHYEAWKGNMPQLDDIVFFAMRI